MELRERCIVEALNIIETEGIENLSLRQVARRLGVSHQAPYKHFKSRDHILAAVVERAFDTFAAYLDNRPAADTLHGELESMGRAYLDYAMAHPLQYRLMFGTPLPDPAEHPAMMQSAQHAFSLLVDCLTRMKQTPQGQHLQHPQMEAVFIWSTLHGVASILNTRVMETIDMPAAMLQQATNHLMMRIGVALGASESHGNEALSDDLLPPQ